MKKQKKEDLKEENNIRPSVYPYIAKKSPAVTIYGICSGTIVSFDIGKIINGQPRNP